MKTEHKYAQVLRWIAEGEEVVYVSPDEVIWKNFGNAHWLVKIANSELSPEGFRLKPRTITVNGREIVSGESEKLKMGTEYFLAELANFDLCEEYEWEGTSLDMTWLRRGLVHLTKENAIAHAKAMLGID